ncbi:hypothetical protein OG352_00510 [Streptomyces sp. NBC_01485]|uniref:hypothetical protein n=1 Tax=Streptomyces sp. NBC_01485 TaxID=2903884 RepID=UPI002E329369|nr:hypothetical protein [Streptomyces sp. NBC_01485]
MARDPRHLIAQVLDPPFQATVQSPFMTLPHAQDLSALQERARHDIGARLGVLASQQERTSFATLPRPWLCAVADLLGQQAVTQAWVGEAAMS